MNDVILKVKCNYCNKSYDIGVNEDDYNDWKYGEGFIQDLLPYLTRAQRELLISNTCDECWDGLFGLEDDDDDDVYDL